MTLITNPTPEMLQAIAPKGPWTLDPVNRLIAVGAVRTLIAMNVGVRAFMDDKGINVNSLMQKVRESLSEDRIKELQAQKPEDSSAFLRGELDKLLAEKSYEDLQNFVNSSAGVRLIGQYHAAAHAAEGMQQMMAMMAMKHHLDGVRDAIFSIVHMAVANSILASNKDIRFDVSHHFLWSVKINEADPEDLQITITRYSFDPKTPEEVAEEHGEEPKDQPSAAPEPSPN